MTKKHLGRVALLIAVASWIAYVVALVLASVDRGLLNSMQVVILSTLVFSVGSLVLSLIALVQGQQRVSAALAFALSVVFCLLISGALYVFVGWFL